MATVQTNEINNDDRIIAIMGPTGCGKSNFIDRLTGSTKLAGTTSLASVTQEVHAVRIPNRFVRNQSIVLVDTPGFDDTNRPDSDILGMIAEWLRITYENDMKLSGILYLHRITDNRMGGTPQRNLLMFGRLCGSEPAKKVVFVTTMWDKISPDVGKQREAELEKFLKPMLNLEAVQTRFDNQPTSAWRIVNLVLTQLDPNLPTRIQEELVDLKRPLKETGAAKAIYDNTQKLLAQFKDTLQSIEREEKKNRDNEPTLAALNEERIRILTELDKVEEEAESLKIPLTRRITAFFSRGPKAKGVKFRGNI